MKRSLTAAAVAASMVLPGVALAANWQLDPSHSAAQFSVRHLMVSKVRGEFGKMAGTVVYDAKAPEKISIDATVDVSTINTRDAKRDEHLRSADFFDVAKHPNMTFKSKSAKSKGKGKLDVTGDLTMRGVTKQVVFSIEGLDTEVTDPWGNVRLGGVATTKINRKDFGLNWNQALEAGGVMVGDQVEITVDVELIKQAADKAQETANK